MITTTIKRFITYLPSSFAILELRHLVLHLK
jgi:hypothetical protein